MPDTDIVTRPLRASDLEAIVAIDAQHTGAAKPDYWRGVLDALQSRGERLQVGVAADVDGRLAGFVIGEVRAFEFGSEPCGWIVAIAVAEPYLRTHVASRLLHAAGRAFGDAGIATLRTMVRRNDVPMLTFFRTNGFTGGPYVQLERAAGGES